MRGIDHQQADMFSYLSPEQRMRAEHPLREVRIMTDEILESMSPLFDAMYAECTRPSLRDSLHLLAVVLEQETELQPTEIITGTAGYTDTIFAIFHIHMLGRYIFILLYTVARGELRPLRDPCTASLDEA